jgi:type II secretory pathway pseudopilin PulG
MFERARARVEDAGETLLELVVAIAILGVVVVAVGSGVALGVRVSSMHRSQTTSGAYVRSYAEAIDHSVAVSSWAGCAATPATYQNPSGFSVPSGYAASVTSVTYWNGSAFAGTCGSDKGLQQLRLTVASNDGRAVEQLALIVRKP